MSGADAAGKTRRDRRWLIAAAAFSVLACLGLFLSLRGSQDPTGGDASATTVPVVEGPDDSAAVEDPAVLGSTTTTFSDRDPNTLYVSPSGSDANSGQSPEVPLATLETAIAQTKPGMTLYVMDGTHRITNPGPTQIAFRRDGSPDAWTRITAAPGAEPVIVATEGTALEPSGSYIEVSGLTIRGETFDVDKNYGVGILVADGHHFLVDGNNISGFATGGIAAVRASHLTFSNNVVYENSKWGPQQGSGLSSWIGQDYGYPDDANGYSDYFIGNVIYRNENLVPSQWIAGGVITDGNGIIIDMNIDSGYSGRTLIANNVIVDNGGRAITVYKSQRVDVVNNSTFANGQTGPTLIGGNSEMNVLDSSDVRAWNNLLWNDGSTPALWVGRSSNVEAFNNALVGGTTTGIDIGANLVFDSNPGVAASAPSPRATDFELTPGSPLINAGAPVPPVVGTDFFRRPRPGNGSDGVDIGALESGEQPPTPTPQPDAPADPPDDDEQPIPVPTNPSDPESRQDPPDDAPPDVTDDRQEPVDDDEQAAPQPAADVGPPEPSPPTERVVVDDSPAASTVDPAVADAPETSNGSVESGEGPSAPTEVIPQSAATPDEPLSPLEQAAPATADAEPTEATDPVINVDHGSQASDDSDPTGELDAEPESATPTDPDPAKPDPVDPDPVDPDPFEAAAQDLASPPVATLAFVDSSETSTSSGLLVPASGIAATLGAVAIGLRAFLPQQRR